MTIDPIDLDAELADITDRFLAGQDLDAAKVSAENETAAEVVRSLQQMVRADSAPSANYRARLTHRLQEEWNAQGYSSRRKSGLIAISFTRRLASIAAVLVVAVAGIIFVIAFQNGGQVSNQGTVQGALNWYIVAGMAVVVGIIGIVIYIRRR